MQSARAKEISAAWLGDAPGARLDQVADVLGQHVPYPVADLVVPLSSPGEPPLDGTWRWLDEELLVLGADALYRIAGMESEARGAGASAFAVTVRRTEFADLRPVQVTEVRTVDAGAAHWGFGPSGERVRIVDDGAPGAAAMARELARRIGWPDFPR
jgi:hypothetical protein